MILRIFILFILFSGLTFSQSIPLPYYLKVSDYELNKWDSQNPAGSYPESMVFHQCDELDPEMNTTFDSNYEYAYDLTSKSRINGLGEKGFSFYNTSQKQPEGGGYLGAAVLGLNTEDRKNIKVSWTGRTIEANSRVYAIALQYKTKEDSSYSSVGTLYVANPEDGHSYEFKDILLPEECNNRELVLLRWLYFHYSGEAGARSELGVDDINVKSDIINNVMETFEDTGKIEVFPNPAKDFINVKYNCDLNDIKYIELIDLNGNRLAFKDDDFYYYDDHVILFFNNKKINKGVYLLRLNFTNFTKSVLFTKY